MFYDHASLDNRTMPSHPELAICSQRQLNGHISRCAGYEFEDFVGGFGGLSLVAPKPGIASPLRLRVRLRNRVSKISRLYRWLGTGIGAEALGKPVDLFVAPIAILRDLHGLAAMGDWRAQAGFSICWIHEVWIDELAKAGPLLDELNRFDHVICCTRGTVEALQACLSVPVSYMPWSVDALAMAPARRSARQSEEARAIDYCNIGGLPVEHHHALWAEAKAGRAFYVFDTERGLRSARDFTEHRWRYVDTLKRSRYFFTPKALAQRTAVRGEQVEFGLRYIEGAAAGAIQIGDVIDCPAFREHLGWEDAVLPLPDRAEDLVPFIRALDADTERVAAIRARNVAECLMRHDHVYRWGALFDLAGLERPQAMAQREAKLRRLAEAFREGLPAGGPEADAPLIKRVFG